MNKKLSSPLDNYTCYKGYDSFGYDIIYYPGRTIKQLVDICDTMESAVGFNTMGYIKYKINSKENLINVHNFDLYVKKNVCPNLLDELTLL